jgi:16S rRNA processing protein RimM
MIGPGMAGSDDRSEPSAPGSQGENELVVVGRVRRPTGIDGTLLVEVYSGKPDRFAIGDTVNTGGRWYEIARTGKSGKSAKLKLVGVDSIEAADPFRGEELAVTAGSLPENPPGVYYHYEILGIDVVTVDGRKLGTLTEIIETGSNDVFVVSPNQQADRRPRTKRDTDETVKKSNDILVPVLDGVIVGVDAKKGVMTIDPPGGLF